MEINKEIKEEINNDNEMMKEFIKNIQSKCPVNIFNLDITQHPKSSLIGMYLMCLSSDEINKELGKMAITNNLSDGSILFFDRHHVIEICAIFTGAVSLLRDANTLNGTTNESIQNISIIDFITKIAEYISIPHKYTDISNFMSSAISSLSDELINYNDPKSFVRLRAIANKIWFVPYNNLDEITSMAKDQYEKIMQKNQPDGDINE